jgi:hypothetical protein
MRFESRYGLVFSKSPAAGKVLGDTFLLQLIAEYTSLIPLDGTCTSLYVARAPIAQYVIKPEKCRAYLENGLMNAVINQRVGDSTKHLTLRQVDLDFDESLEFMARTARVKSVGLVVEDMDGWTFTAGGLNVHSLSLASVSELTEGALSFLPYLQNLVVRNVEVVALGALAQLRQLRSLTLEGVRELLPAGNDFELANLNFVCIKDSTDDFLDFFEALPSVQEVTWVDLEVRALDTFVQIFPNIKKLTLLDAMIEEATALTKCRNLDELVTDGPGLAVVPSLPIRKLTVMDVNATEASLAVGDKFPNLEVLIVKDTKIKNLQFITHMKNLLELDCSGTKINCLDSLTAATKLKKLNFSNCAVKSVKPLLDMDSLQVCTFSVAKTLTLDLRFAGLDILTRLLDF